MSDHTPGPWHVDPDPRVDGADQVCEANGNTADGLLTADERKLEEEREGMHAQYLAEQAEKDDPCRMPVGFHATRANENSGQ